MRVAWGGYGRRRQPSTSDFGVKLTGSVADVKAELRSPSEISVVVDWKAGTGNGDKLTEAQINASGVLCFAFAAAMAAAAGVWHNLTKDVKCYNISNGDATTASPHRFPSTTPETRTIVAPPAAAARRLEAAAAANRRRGAGSLHRCEALPGAEAACDGLPAEVRCRSGGG